MAQHVRITRDGYSHSGTRYPVGSVLRVSKETAHAILDYEDPPWGEKVAAADAKESGIVIHDLTTAEPANAVSHVPPAEQPPAK
jgi:hypothetical protein